MKVSISIAAFAILCAIAYFEQAEAAPELRNFWEDIDEKAKSVYKYAKRIYNDPKGEGRVFLEKCVATDVAMAANEGAKRNSEEGTLNIAIGAIRKAVAKCARKLEVYSKKKADQHNQPDDSQPESEPKEEEHSDAESESE